MPAAVVAELPQGNPNSSSGKWSFFKTSHETTILWSCPRCGEVDQVDGMTIGFHKNGIMAEEAVCVNPTCKFKGVIKLVGWETRNRL